MFCNKMARGLSVKSLAVAVAMGAALSTPAWALNLSLYGVGHLSYDSINNGTQTSQYIHSNSSRLGFKGSDDIGNGLAVIFQYESGVDLTGNGTGDGNGGAPSSGQIFTTARDSFIGLKGGFGSVVMGRLPALNQWLYDYNLFADQVGDLGNIFGGDGLAGRVDHAVSYHTPVVHGLSLALTNVPKQGTRNSEYNIAKVNYTVNGFKLGGVYGRFGNGGNWSTSDITAITGSYSHGMFNFGGGWQRETNVGSAHNQDRNLYTFGAALKISNSDTAKFQYAKAANLSGTSNTSASQFAVGYDHNLDKLTTLYVAYARTNNAAAASFSAYDYGHGNQGVPAIAAGGNPWVISVGIVYKFNDGL